jgi:putative glutamine amidotransferase
MVPSTTDPAPIVLIPACNRMLGHHPFHVVGKKYADAVRLAGGLPLVVPSAEANELDRLLDVAEGVLLTGSASNVHPSHFGEAVRDLALPLDAERDAWTLPLIKKVIERGIPLFAICRGFQETNVALGGTLHQAVHEVDGYRDHRAPADAAVEAQYAQMHPIEVTSGGLLESIVGRSSIAVNSIHGQGVNRLAPGLHVEAIAPDGLVEAFSIPAAKGFNLCVQWHPEWQAARDPVSVQLFKAFGEACSAYRERRRTRQPQQG